jgi:hypothetical protein
MVVGGEDGSKICWGAQTAQTGFPAWHNIISPMKMQEYWDVYEIIDIDR